MSLLDTGARRDEMIGLTLDDVDLDLDVLVVLGKGRRERSLPFGQRAGRPGRSCRPSAAPAYPPR
jgi:integrase/recombinase XerC